MLIRTAEGVTYIQWVGFWNAVHRIDSPKEGSLSMRLSKNLAIHRLPCLPRAFPSQISID